MADNDLFPRLAGAVFGGVLPGLGIPAAAAIETLIPVVGGAFSSAVNKPKVGTVLSYKGGRPFKVYAGPWGKQSLESYMALRAKAPNDFPQLSGTLPASLVQPSPAAESRPKPVPPVTSPGTGAPTTGGTDNTEKPQTEPGTVGDVSAGKEGETLGSTTPDPLSERLYGAIDRAFDPAFQDAAVQRNLKQFIATSAISSALGADKSAQRFKREVEIEKIKQWNEAFRAQISANALQNIAVSQAVIAMQQPNANTVAALQQGSNAAAQVLGVPTLRVT